MLNGEIDNFLQEVLKRETRTDLGHLAEGYRLCAQSEGKSSATIAIVEASVRYFEGFLSTSGLSADIVRIGVQELRHFIVYLQGRQRFAQHRFTKPQQSSSVWAYREWLSPCATGFLVLGTKRGLHRGESILPCSNTESAEKGHAYLH